MVTVAMSDGLSDEESTQGRPLTPCKLVSRSLLLDWLAEAEGVLNQCIADDSPIQFGPSVFDLSVSGPPPATSEGLGPLRRKQKQNVFLPLEGPGGPDQATLGGDAAS